MFEPHDQEAFFEFIRQMFKSGKITKNSHASYRGYVNKLDKLIPENLTSLPAVSFSKEGISKIAESLPQTFRKKYGLTMLKHYSDYRLSSVNQPHTRAEIKASNVWIFQAVPQEYDLKKELRVGRIDDWRVTRFRSKMKKGDKVIFWQAGNESGIYGTGELINSPADQNGPKVRADVKYTNQFIPPIFKEALLNHPVLKRLSILKPPFRGTNFKATQEQWDALGMTKTEDIPQIEEVTVPSRFIEGATRTITVNAYERSRQARDKCLKYHGHSCSVCDFNFEEIFGEHGRNFIHVHHIKPLSEVRKEYIIDPINDLCPICPNCHAMIHHKEEMMSIEYLRQLIGKS